MKAALNQPRAFTRQISSINTDCELNQFPKLNQAWTLEGKALWVRCLFTATSGATSSPSPLPLLPLAAMSTAALSAARGSRKLAASRQATRTLATESHPSSSTSSPADGIPQPGRVHRWRDKGELNKKHLMRRWSNNSVYVRAWDSINSMPEFFAMLRGVEKRFGRVREFRVGRVSDLPDCLYALPTQSFHRTPMSLRHILASSSVIFRTRRRLCVSLPRARTSRSKFRSSKLTGPEASASLNSTASYTRGISTGRRAHKGSMVRPYLR